MIRLLIVEDSKTVQQALVAAFGSDPEITVVGTADSGEAAVEAAGRLRPDIITMDINLPGMDGFEATRAIMSSCPVPIVVVSGRLDPKDSATLFRVMQAGALMVLPKPEPVGSPGHDQSVKSLIQHVKLMSEIKVVRRSFTTTLEPFSPPLSRPEQPSGIRAVAIGASTGGPPLLQQVLASLSPRFGAPVLIVQHMADGFTENFVHWLNQSSRLPVQLAGNGMQLAPGQVYVAPNGRHLEIGSDDRIVLTSRAPENGLCPSVSVLFRSMARRYGRNGAGVLLSGMGTDGANGLQAIREAGGLTIAQDRQSSVVFGMPGEAIRLNAAQYILPPEGIIELLAGVIKEQTGKCHAKEHL